MPAAIRRRGDTVTHVGKSTPTVAPPRPRRALGSRITGPCHVEMFAPDRVTGETRRVWSGEYAHADAATSSDTYALIFVQRRDDRPDAVKAAPVGPSGAFIHVGHSGWFDLPTGTVANGITPTGLPSDVRAAVDGWLAKRKHAACRLLDRAAVDYDTLRVKAVTGPVTAGEAAAVMRGDARD